MGKKNFLPMSNDAESSLMGGTGVYQNTTMPLPKTVKTRPWVMRMFSVLSFIGCVFGITVVGFSFKMVGENQVGYYNSEAGYREPGLYFQFPWTKEEMHFVNVGVEFLKLEQLTGTLKNTENHS